ncbi:hypothetical protein F0U44_00975 [Nocardioides humilatus]|uniref:Uncharacterized protein n=1 Tax=Nocardioides humilatus TaxID=2607660 RepID=A0A5B1LMS8_9ACTN|nr:hypothetical protein [Nocardioides humilatus]KAA1420947.1 hypothetical protein F0U44_00975 [Nocardioides humilatus]
MPAPSKLAQQLLDAQVAFHLNQLRGDLLTDNAATIADEIIDAVGKHQIADLVDRELAKDVIGRVLTTVPRSPAVAGVIDLVLDVVQAGPEQPYPLGELVDRDRVAELVDALLALSPVLDRALTQLADSPLIGTVATRFMGRIVGEVLQANKAVADKVPGLGTLMSFGTSAASKVVGAADRQFEGILGDTVGKSGAFAVKRLSRIITETMQDPTTRDAILQAWDVVAAEPVSGLDRHVSREEIGEVVDAVHELAAAALESEHARVLAGVLVDAFFDHFGGYTGAELLEQLEIDKADLRDDVVKAAPGIIGLLDESGDLERILRARLEPFYSSAEVAALLG